MKTKEKKARLISYYLPQFHPIPENNEWWGEGFTEWTNVAKARPFFHGHYQPHLPVDLGFYDLRLSEVRVAQAKMAEENGIEGFCYWHYWFAGKRLLERPFNEVLKSGKPDFPFCLGWANKTWSGIWTGCPDRVLIEQTYPGKADEEAHFHALEEAFFDKRYLTVDGKPIFYLYKPDQLPESNRFLDHWRDLAVKSGLKGIYFIGESQKPNWNPEESGFDASVPHIGGGFRNLMERPKNFFEKIQKKIYYHIHGLTFVYSYKDYIKYWDYKLSNDYSQYPCVLTNWDNTPRSNKNGYILTGPTPELFRKHLRKTIDLIGNRELDKRIVFVKSWNEWAEGNYIEPDQQFGRKYLEVCKNEVYHRISEYALEVN